MKWILVYKGKGMYEDDTNIWLRVLKTHVDSSVYHVETVSAIEIINGRLSKDTALLAFGGGYDLGLIEALGQEGMANIRDFVTAGGSYLGICSGAYFACDRIEFDKHGPLEVLGERFLKFYPGTGIGPLFKPYDYQSRRGAAAVTVDFHHLEETRNQYIQNKNTTAGNQPEGCNLKDCCYNTGDKLDRPMIKNDFIRSADCEKVTAPQKDCVVLTADTSRLTNYESKRHILQNMESQKLVSQDECQISQKVESQSLNCEIKSQICSNSYNKMTNPLDLKRHYSQKLHENSNVCSGANFSCKVYFNGGCYFKEDSEDHLDKVTVLSSYLDLPGHPEAIVQCKVGAGLVVLSGVHLEYDAEDIDDGDTTVTEIIPCLRNSAKHRQFMLRSILQQLSIMLK